MAGTMASIQELGPASVILLVLGQGSDPVTSVQPLKQTHQVRVVAGCLRDPALRPSWCPPNPGWSRTVLSTLERPFNLPCAMCTPIDPGQLLNKPPWTWKPIETRLLPSAVCNIRKCEGCLCVKGPFQRKMLGLRRQAQLVHYLFLFA